MKVAVVTPYYKEDTEVIKRCVISVKRQTYKNVEHFMIADGYPIDGRHLRGTTHVLIPASRDCGNTPRGVGVLTAMAQDAEAIALLDADCWFEPEHLEKMVKVMQDSGAAIVTCPRNLYRPDGTFMAVDKESEGAVWNDTNCFLIRRDAFRLFDGWMFAERKAQYIQDRIFWERVKNSGLKMVRMPDATVNYTTTVASHYIANNETPCEGAKFIMERGGEYVRIPYTDFKTVNVEFHTLCWPSADGKLVSAHSKVCKHFGLDVAYTVEEVPHGMWMDNILAHSTADVVGFLDVDCIPLNRQVVEQAITYAGQNQSMIGIAQVSNHIPPASHIFAAPAFFFIWRETWDKLGRPTFAETPQADVAENVSYAAEMARLPFRTLFPTHYTKAPDEGIWKLHSYGVYGIGTVFEGGVYHLYQGRFPDNVDLFVKTCEEVVNGTFTTKGLLPCR